MPITKSSQALVEDAMKVVKTYSAADIKTQLASGKNLQLVDIRDIRELQAPEGTALGSAHAPRGMLEFWVDPASPYFKPLFGDESKEYVLFCAAGWRSALTAKTLQDMGMTNVAHIDGGFKAMREAGIATESLEERKAKKS